MKTERRSQYALLAIANDEICLIMLLQLSEATSLLQKSHKIVVPYPNPKPDKNVAYKLAYARPAKINIVGSYAAKTMVKSEGVLTADMIVVMPKSIFQDKDFLNYRYFYKRAYYLACIAAGIQESARKEFKVSFEYLNGNSLHPILVIKNKTSKLKVSICPNPTNSNQKQIKRI